MIRGWCPTVHAPMPSGDGLLVRVKPFGGRLPPAALRALADAVARYGNGVVELTSRGNVQIRGVTDAAAFARAMVTAGLADPNPAREARRNVVTVPPCDDAVVAEVEAIMMAAEGLAAKCAVVVDGDEVRVGDAVVGLGDLAGHLAASTVTPPSPASAGRSHSMSLAHFSLSRGRERETSNAIAPPASGRGWGAGYKRAAHLLHLPFGQTTPATLDHFASFETELRTTPWRAFLSPILIPGFESPNGIAACPGAPACGSATVPARSDAARLRDHGFTDIHVSGCAKGCAHAGAATTLVGNNGRYDLVRNGRASDTPALRGLTLEQAMAVL